MTKISVIEFIFQKSKGPKVPKVTPNRNLWIVDLYVIFGKSCGVIALVHKNFATGSNYVTADFLHKRIQTWQVLVHTYRSL